MRTQKKVIGALGAVFGVAIALTVTAAPASARPAPDSTTTVTSSLSCASFEGVKITGSSVGYSGIGLRAGESLKVTVSPAATGDTVFLAAATGASLAFYEGAAPSYTFSPLSSTVWSLSWSYYLANHTQSTATRTWTFDCSSTSTPATTPPATTPPAPTPTPIAAPTHGKSRGK